jgi:hypothetical protein
MKTIRILLAVLVVSVAFAVAMGTRNRSASDMGASIKSSVPAAARPNIRDKPGRHAAKTAFVPAPPAAREHMAVAFRLDDSLTRGLYMGDRWVIPPNSYHTVQKGPEYTVKLQTVRIDTRGERSKLIGNWRADNVRMVSIIPDRDDAVMLVVHTPGRGSVRVSTTMGEKILRIDAIERDGAMDVRITPESG